MKVILEDEEVELIVELLSRAKDARALNMITRLRNSSEDTPETDAYREIAMEMLRHEEGYCEVDNQATVSVGNEGAYVQCWIFIDKDEIRPEIKVA